MGRKRAEHVNGRTRCKAWELWVFVIVLFLLVGMLLMRFWKTEIPKTADSDKTVNLNTEANVPETTLQPVPDMQETEQQPAITPRILISNPESPLLATTPEQPLQQEPGLKQKRNAVYSEQTYQLVTDMVYTRRHMGSDGEETIRIRLDELKTLDPELGELWEGIMNYWAYVSDGLSVYPDVLPDGLPEDKSLCITVLGFQLMYDGEMAPELVGRCETALASAQKYPNAYLLVTGGGTAYGNRSVTEADVMAEWFKNRGVNPDRIIIENRSLTTDQNATYSCRILTESYPDVKDIAIVSSDYHVALGSMLFTEAALLHAYEYRSFTPYQVVSNAGYRTAGNEEYSNPANFGSDIWVMADPTY